MRVAAAAEEGGIEGHSDFWVGRVRRGAPCHGALPPARLRRPLSPSPVPWYTASLPYYRPNACRGRMRINHLFVVPPSQLETWCALLSQMP